MLFINKCLAFSQSIFFPLWRKLSNYFPPYYNGPRWFVKLKKKKYFTTKHAIAHLRDPCSYDKEMNMMAMIRGINYLLSSQSIKQAEAGHLLPETYMCACAPISCTVWRSDFSLCMIHKSIYVKCLVIQSSWRRIENK